MCAFVYDCVISFILFFVVPTIEKHFDEKCYIKKRDDDITS